VTTYRLPLAEQPRGMHWDTATDEHDAPASVAWWEATRAVHGGRQNTPVVQASNGYMYVFNSRGSYVGAVEHGPYRGGIGAFEFWQLERPAGDQYALWVEANRIRPAGCVLARVDGVIGVVDRATVDQRGRSWRVAYACILLGFYPPMALDLPATSRAFDGGVEEVGERAARRIKRALLSRLARERRVHRERAELIERNWR
jgi:hypothetical protein